MNIFKGLTDKQILAVRQCPAAFTFYKKQIVYREGDPAYGLFVVERGRVVVYRRTEQGQEILMQVGPGGVVGAVGIFLESGRRTTTAVALEDSSLIGIPGRARELFAQIDDPQAAVTLLENVICILGQMLRDKENKELRASMGATAPLMVEVNPPRSALATIEYVLQRQGTLKRLFRHHTLKAAETLITEGEPSEGFYFVQSGVVDVIKGLPGETVRLLNRMSAPTIVGELGFFSGEKRYASVRAQTDIAYTAFPGSEFRRMKKREPREALELLFAAAQVIDHLMIEALGPPRGNAPAPA